MNHLKRSIPLIKKKQKGHPEILSQTQGDVMHNAKLDGIPEQLLSQVYGS